MHVRVDLDRVRANAEAARRLLSGDVVGVVKGVDARREIVDAMLAGGVDGIAVSRTAHLSRLGDLAADLVMLRVPAPAEVPAVVAGANVSLQSSGRVLELVDAEATHRGTTHEVVPMVDAGDGREGSPPSEVRDVLDAIEASDALSIRAVGVNLGCFRDAPDPDAIARVVDDLPDYPVSVGGSGTVPIRDELPAAVSSYRLGDALLTGTFRGRPIEGLRRGAFELRAEVLASRADEAVIDVGNVTSDPRYLVPEGDVRIERWSNELSVVDAPLEVGDRIAFEMEYDAIATTFDTRFG